MKTKIIAEIGWNHMGDMDLAKKMIDATKEAGADYAKFQTWSTKNLKSGPWDTDGRLEIYKKAELKKDQHFMLKEYCDSIGIQFLTSVFNHNDVSWLSELGIETIKVASMEIHNENILEAVNSNFNNILLSTGASNWSELLNAKKIIDESKLTLLHCVSSYPTKAENVNLPRIDKIREIHPKVGYSGHFKGIDDAIAALSYNIDYIEKHFTIDNNLPGRDNQFSITTQELKELVNYKNNFFDMNKDLGNEMQDLELDVHENYRSRWTLDSK